MFLPPFCGSAWKSGLGGRIPLFPARNTRRYVVWSVMSQEKALASEGGWAGSSPWNPSQLGRSEGKVGTNK